MPATLAPELAATIAALPTFSAQVFRALLNGLYAEPGFSDVEASDIAKTLKISEQAVGGALSHLSSVGLVWADTCEVNGREHTFLFASSAILNGDAAGDTDLKAEVLALLDAQLSDAPAPTTKPRRPASDARKASKRARRIIRNYLRAATWYNATAGADVGHEDAEAATAAYDAAHDLLSTLPGYGSGAV
jgi:hypothetical protein